MLQSGQDAVFPNTATRRDGAWNGNGLSRAALTKAKMLTLAAMPSARTRAAVRVNPGPCGTAQREPEIGKDGF